MSEFLYEKHISSFRRLLCGVLPPSASEADQVRVVLCYFALAALDAMGPGELDKVLDNSARSRMASWIIATTIAELQSDFNVACIYAALASLSILGSGLDALPTEKILVCIGALQINEATPGTGGAFRARQILPSEADVRYTYAAAASCSLLGRWDYVDVPAAVAYITRCQSYEGGFGLCPGQESHGGATYCALAALDLFGSIPQPPRNPVAHVGSSGTTFGRNAMIPRQPCRASDCCLPPSIIEACQRKVGLSVDSAALARWLSLRSLPTCAESYLGKTSLPTAGDSDDLCDDDPRYYGGLSGRAGKPADVCYAWWIGASRLLLQSAASLGVGQGGGVWPTPWSHPTELGRFLLRCQFPAGGSGKDWESLPDPLHSCYSMIGLSICGVIEAHNSALQLDYFDDLLPHKIVASLGVSCKAAENAAAAAVKARSTPLDTP